MKIVIDEFQTQDYQNTLNAFLVFDSVDEKFSLESVEWDEMTKESFLLFTKKWKQIADSEGIDFNMKVSSNDVIAELEDLDAQLISIVEDGGDELSTYTVDESQTISNAGEAVQYIWNSKKYEIITWNENADEHEPESKTISKLVY